MKDGKKILGVLGIVVSSALTAIVTTWMNDREIKKQVSEQLEDQKTEN